MEILVSYLYFRYRKNQGIDVEAGEMFHPRIKACWPCVTRCSCQENRFL